MVRSSGCARTARTHRGSMPSCCSVVPSNEADLGAIEAAGIDLDVADGSTFDTTGDCHAGSLLGNCELVRLQGSPDVCVCRADAARIGSLVVTGDIALALFAVGAVEVDGTILVTPGAGTGFDYAEPGNAGGSYGSSGGNGGGMVVVLLDPHSSPGSVASGSVGSATLVPLSGGMNGQASAAGDGPRGGLGGGALQISAGESIVVHGGITVPGAGGLGCSSSNKGGGGSGGGLLLEAPYVAVSPGGFLAANGGGGGGSGQVEACAGEDGRTDGTPAAGGDPVGAEGPSLRGGTGATEASPAQNGFDGGDYNNGGWQAFYAPSAGGGGLGRIRVNTTSACACQGTASPAPSEGRVQLE